MNHSKVLPLILGLTLAVSSFGCVVVAEEVRGYGDLTIDYDFEGLGCFDSGVDSLDFTLEDTSGGIVRGTVSCAPRYYTFDGLIEDDYLITISAYDFTDYLLYTGVFSTYVSANVTNEVAVSLRAE